MYPNFAAIKSTYSMGDVLPFLDLEEFDQSVDETYGEQLRGPCPVCKDTGPRSLIITPGHNVYFCYADPNPTPKAKEQGRTRGRGGDVIALVAHLKGLPVRQAGDQILKWMEDKTIKQQTPAKDRAEEADGGLRPLAYLRADNDLVREIGFSEEICGAVGIGYANKGMMKGKVAVPVRLPDGTLVGYIGIEAAKLPPKWSV